MSSDTTAKENVSVVDSSLTDWKQDKGHSDDPGKLSLACLFLFFLAVCFLCLFVIVFVELLWTESSSYRSKEDRKPSNVEGCNFLESSNESKNTKPGYQTRYFIIKSLNYDNIQLSLERGIWATQVMNEPILEGAFHVRSSPSYIVLHCSTYNLTFGVYVY